MLLTEMSTYIYQWMGRLSGRALCRITLLPVFVDTWMLTVKPVYKLLNVADDLKWATNTHVTPFTLTFKVSRHN